MHEMWERERRSIYGTFADRNKPRHPFCRPLEPPITDEQHSGKTVPQMEVRHQKAKCTKRISQPANYVCVCERICNVVKLYTISMHTL